jgi:hypothetical protein
MRFVYNNKILEVAGVSYIVLIWKRLRDPSALLQVSHNPWLLLSINVQTCRVAATKHRGNSYWTAEQRMYIIRRETPDNIARKLTVNRRQHGEKSHREMTDKRIQNSPWRNRQHRKKIHSESPTAYRENSPWDDGQNIYIIRRQMLRKISI